jgi:hypothetical protein
MSAQPAENAPAAPPAGAGEDRPIKRIAVIMGASSPRLVASREARPETRCRRPSDADEPSRSPRLRTPAPPRPTPTAPPPTAMEAEAKPFIEHLGLTRDDPQP